MANLRYPAWNMCLAIKYPCKVFLAGRYVLASYPIFYEARTDEDINMYSYIIAIIFMSIYIYIYIIRTWKHTWHILLPVQMICQLWLAPSDALAHLDCGRPTWWHTWSSAWSWWIWWIECPTSIGFPKPRGWASAGYSWMVIVIDPKITWMNRATPIFRNEPPIKRWQKWTETNWQLLVASHLEEWIHQAQKMHFRSEVSKSYFKITDFSKIPVMFFTVLPRSSPLKA